MKKLGICLMLLCLTGCQSAYELEDKESTKINHQLAIQNEVENVGTYTKGEWEELTDKLDTLENEGDWGYSKWNIADERSQWQGAILSEGILSIDDINADSAQKAVQIIENHIGQDFTAFIKASEEMDPWELRETVIGDYGILLKNWSYGVEEEATKQLYIAKSSVKFTDEAKQQWADEICGDNMLITAISTGKEETLVEFTYPSTIAERNMGLGGDDVLTVYYQAYLNGQDEVDKIRMVFNSWGSERKVLSEAQLDSINRLISYTSKDKVDISEMQKSIETVLEGRSKGNKGLVGSFKYEVTSDVQKSGYGKFVVVELSPA